MSIKRPEPSARTRCPNLVPDVVVSLAGRCQIFSTVWECQKNDPTNDFGHTCWHGNTVCLCCPCSLSSFSFLFCFPLACFPKQKHAKVSYGWSILRFTRFKKNLKSYVQMAPKMRFFSPNRLLVDFWSIFGLFLWIKSAHRLVMWASWSGGKAFLFYLDFLDAPDGFGKASGLSWGKPGEPFGPKCRPNGCFWDPCLSENHSKIIRSIRRRWNSMKQLKDIINTSKYLI